MIKKESIPIPTIKEKGDFPTASFHLFLTSLPGLFVRIYYTVVVVSVYDLSNNLMLVNIL